jgi:hypothetical protein
VRLFEIQEEWSSYAFTHHVSAAGAHARRDYDDRWRRVVGYVAGRHFHHIFADLVIDAGDDQPTTESFDKLGVAISDWKDNAADEAKSIELLADFAFSHRDIDDSGDLDWVDESLRAWDRLKTAGLDMKGALWRRRAVPHVLVPSHVARHYGAERASLYRRLHQAARAFIFGAPLAALALQRAVLEQVLESHWGAEGGQLRNAEFPELVWGARADRLKRIANEALHGDPEKLSPEQLDRSIIENFLLLRLLIERAPEVIEKKR